MNRESIIYYPFYLYRSSRISCESDVAEGRASVSQEPTLGRSASTGMVNVDRESWQRVTEGNYDILGYTEKLIIVDCFKADT